MLELFANVKCSTDLALDSVW